MALDTVLVGECIEIELRHNEEGGMDEEAMLMVGSHQDSLACCNPLSNEDITSDEGSNHPIPLRANTLKIWEH